MKKIIFISFVRLTDRVVRDWHIDYFIQNNLDVEFWDIVGIVRGEIKEFASVYPNYLKKLTSISEYENMIIENIKNNENTIYIMLISYSYRFSKIFKLLSKYHCKMVSIEQGMLPTYHSTRNEKILNHLKHPLRFFNIIFNRIITNLYIKSKVVEKYHIIFAAGNYYLKQKLNANLVIPVNLCDYDIFLKYKTNSPSDRLFAEKYAVFLDINLPFQTDLEILNMPILSSKMYFQEINNFFDKIEKKYDIKIIIAAHPTSNYSSQDFNNRRIVRLNTAVLVRDSEFVITHHSTSLSYAVLNYKPIIFIYTNDMMKIYSETVMKDIKAQSRYLIQPNYNISNITNNFELKFNEVDRNVYDKYKYEFLTSAESENKFSREIMLDYFLNI